MTVQPVWITLPGKLGTLPEGVFYSVQLQAILPNTVGTIYYKLIAGQLPYGLSVNNNGLISGVPRAIVYVNGIPTEVSYDVTSEFVIRAYTTRTVNTVAVIDRLCDQTFTFVVSGAGAPEWITPAGQIALWQEGDLIQPGYQLLYTDNNTADVVTTSLVSGSLPPGLTVNDKGLISGYVGLISGTADVEFTFTMAVTNGLVTNLRTFSIMVESINAYSADTTLITVDSTTYTADMSSKIAPFIINPQGSIGTTRNDSYFAYQFTGISLYGDALGFIAGTSLPPGLTLGSTTGWLYGNIPNTGLTENTYNFTIQTYPLSQPGFTSQYYNYNLTIEGSIATGITWLVPADLGTIQTGTPSTLYVAATDISGLSLQYRLDPSSVNQLPPGLTLQPDGTITGTVGFQLFSIDGGTTTFDNNATTFDLTFTFTVEAYSANGAVNVFKTFTIEVYRTSYYPYDNLYIKCMPPVDEVQLLRNFLTNPNVFPQNLIYRPGDPNFGVARNVIYYHAYGLTAGTVDEYVRSLSLNHYWKNLTLGELQTARAVDPDGNTLYEVIYSPVIDDLVNNEGETVSKEVVLPYPLNPNTPEEQTVVYPNGLVDMRNQVIDQVGQVSNYLPLWMVSKQTDGTVLGFTPAWVVAYCKPGTSGQVLYNIEQTYSDTFNVIDFTADRYELDRTLSYNWDPVTQEWDTGPPGVTTFDTNCHFQFELANDPSSYVFTGGSRYSTGDQILISGTSFGGTTPANDVVVAVYSVDTAGAITGAFCSGNANSTMVGAVFSNVSGANIIGSGNGAAFNFTAVNGVTTLFDGGSCNFVTPVPANGADIYDAYLLYPKYNVLESVPQVGNTYPVY